MKLYDWKLDDIPIDCDTSARLVSYQGIIFRDLFYKFKLNCNICLLDTGLIDSCSTNTDINITATKINNSEIDIIVYLSCDHAWLLPTQNNLYASTHKLLSLISKPKIYISWGYSTEITDRQIRYPIWATMCVNNRTSLLTPTDILPKKYLYSSLSNIIRPSRIINLLEFQQSKYYDKSLITFNSLNESVEENQIYNELATYRKDYIDQFKNIIPTLPINTATSNDEITLINIIDNDVIYDYCNSAYRDSYVNVITETSYVDKFFSEKTFKPILAKQFFVIIAGKGSINVLKELGFDTYDDIIDHDRYDKSPDNVRIQDVHLLLQDMQYYNWEQIYKDTAERREKNRQLLLDLTFEKKFLSELEQMITTIVKPT
jgi:hypothetical protein